MSTEIQIQWHPQARQKIKRDTELKGTHATEGSYKVWDFSPTEHPEAGISILKARDPKPSQAIGFSFNNAKDGVLKAEVMKA